MSADELYHPDQGGSYRVHSAAKDNGNREGPPKTAMPLRVEIGRPHRFSSHSPLLVMTSGMSAELVRKA